MSYFPVEDCLNPDEWRDLGYKSVEDILWSVQERDHAAWSQDRLKEIGYTYVALDTDSDYRFDRTIMAFLYRLRDMNVGFAPWTSVAPRTSTNTIHAWFSKDADGAIAKLIWAGLRERVSLQA